MSTNIIALFFRKRSHLFSKSNLSFVVLSAFLFINIEHSLAGSFEVDDNGPDIIPSALHFELNKGKPYALCRDYVSYLRRRQEYDACEQVPEFDKQARKDGFRTIDWTPQVLKDYRDVLLVRQLEHKFRKANPQNKQLYIDLFNKSYTEERIKLRSGRININNSGGDENILKLDVPCPPSGVGFVSVLNNDGTYNKSYYQGVVGEPFIYQSRTFLLQDIGGSSIYIYEPSGSDTAHGLEGYPFTGVIYNRVNVCYIKRILSNAK